MASLVYDGQEGFAGGYNSAGLTGPIAPNQFAAMTNVRALVNGDLAKRPGLKSMLTLATNYPATLNFWRKDSSTGQVVIVDSAGAIKLATFSPTTGLLTVTSTTAVGDASLGLTAAHFVTGGADELYLSSNAGKLYKLTAAARLGGSTPSNLNRIWVYSQRLFGVTETDMTLYWSGLNDGDTMDVTASGGGHATVRSFGGGILRGGFALGSLNVLVHDSALSVFEGRTFDDIQIQAGTAGLAAHIGGIYGNSFGAIDGIGYVVSARGLFIVTADGRVAPYQQPNRVDPIREAIVASGGVESVFLADNPRANEIWFCVHTRTHTGDFKTPTVFIYHKQLQQFTGKLTLTANGTSAITGMITGGYMDTGTIRPQLMLSMLSAAGTYHVAGCDFQDPALEVFQDITVNYTSSVQCRRFFTDEPRSRKAWSKAFVMMGSGALGTSAVDSATGATVSYTTPIGGAVSPTTALGAGEVSQVPLSGSGHCLDLTITDSGSSSTGWSVSSVEVSATDDGLVGH